MFKKKTLPTSVQIYIHGKGAIDLNSETGRYDATINFSAWFRDELDGETNDYNVGWGALRWRTIKFTPIGFKSERHFSLDADECDVLLTFEQPWSFTMDAESMDAAQDQLIALFQARYDSHMGALTKEGVHREISFKMLGAGSLTLKPDSYGW